VALEAQSLGNDVVQRRLWGVGGGVVGGVVGVGRGLLVRLPRLQRRAGGDVAKARLDAQLARRAQRDQFGRVVANG
jgi:hypothetical protein